MFFVGLPVIPYFSVSVAVWMSFSRVTTVNTKQKNVVKFRGFHCGNSTHWNVNQSIPNPHGLLEKDFNKLNTKDPEKSRGVAIGKSNHVFTCFYINGMRENKKTHENHFLSVAIWLYIFSGVSYNKHRKKLKKQPHCYEIIPTFITFLSTEICCCCCCCCCCFLTRHPAM